MTELVALISVRGATHELRVEPSATVEEVLAMLPTDVSAASAKVVHKGRALERSCALGTLGASPVKLMLVGSTAEEIERVQTAKPDAALRPLGEEARGPAAARPARPAAAAARPSPYGFGELRVLPGFPDGEAAMEILRRLQAERGIQAIMEKYKWRVGALEEMYPRGKVGVDPVCVLGYNTNRGQSISLRLRTDDLRGFRHYNTVLKVLFHELAHNEHSEHDAAFWQLARAGLDEAGRAGSRRGRRPHELPQAPGRGGAGWGPAGLGEARRLGGDESLRGLLSAREAAGIAAQARPPRPWPALARSAEAGRAGAQLRLTEEERALAAGCGAHAHAHAHAQAHAQAPSPPPAADGAGASPPPPPAAAPVPPRMPPRPRPRLRLRFPRPLPRPPWRPPRSPPLRPSPPPFPSARSPSPPPPAAAPTPPPGAPSPPPAAAPAGAARGVEEATREAEAAAAAAGDAALEALAAAAGERGRRVAAAAEALLASGAPGARAALETVRAYVANALQRPARPAAAASPPPGLPRPAPPARCRRIRRAGRGQRGVLAAGGAVPRGGGGAAGGRLRGGGRGRGRWGRGGALALRSADPGLLWLALAALDAALAPAPPPGPEGSPHARAGP
eukprot:tig00000670_g3016.t1